MSLPHQLALCGLCPACSQNNRERKTRIRFTLVQFEIVERVDAQGVARRPEAWETGTKDTLIAYPGEITRFKATFDREGQYTYHCHILEHEDNEMMRPYCIGPLQSPG
jgi:FtsP/CotA-like multicopper oxidase with cupredoxin domain